MIHIQNLIVTVRGVQVMMDSDLAQVYDVESRRLNEQVKRNIERFPESFRFELTRDEYDFLRSQIATLENGRGKHRKYLPYVFTEQGVFYDDQVYDAYRFAADLVRKTKENLLLIDNFVDDTVLTLLCKRKKDVEATIYSKTISKQLALDLKKHNEQYPPTTVELFKEVHDRFLIIDEKEIYHIDASLKDLGKKWFAFSRFDSGVVEMLIKLKDET